ncbi:hypothetical protein RND81_03G099000 [Saponaria officinalis]|uniref:Endonuclease/exonuclease/phosphatase domain-containing protein n=1 Tax=Saponaria officinalis TaxID=3572 RepID=A0AAW1M5P7_SAPOF
MNKNSTNQYSVSRKPYPHAQTTFFTAPLVHLVTMSSHYPYLDLPYHNSNFCHNIPQFAVLPPTRSIKIPPWREMLAPFMGVMVPESPMMDIKFEVDKEDLSSLRMEISLVSRAYLSSLLYSHDHMSDRMPNLSPNLFHITCMEVVKTYKPSILVLVETHMGGEHAMKVSKILGYSGHSRVDVIGFNGGIWLYWRPELVSINLVTKHPQSLTVEVSRRVIPGPTNRKELWVELERFALANNHPWLLAGDFNENRSLAERHGGNQNMARRCKIFNNWTENCKLIEFEFLGPSHTWARGNSTKTRHSVRPDRALCNSEWSTFFSDASVKHLPAYQSDHNPLLISPNGFALLNSIQRSFRFQAAWLTHENFTDFNNGMKKYLVIYLKKRQLLARIIEGCQKKLSIQRDKNLIKLEAKLRKKLDEVLDEEEILWYHKSRVEFLRDGDRNTSGRNKINALKNDQGVWVDNKAEVKQLVVEYYKRLYTDDTP